ncbi:unnamed protein product [Fusarium graminearum]|uniref:Chromosome 3, complete genome n=2 Tax=Gibberella zeae TaxID=5518 RepID=A0A0E0SQL3_GIBZE|nr:hypothetical protein FG05_30590 [Fusarium graminearum]CAF3542083.1 unnamed protein product [Fusarium graminearum]CAF3546960.1 unnamed protein product [Fusarium graminearum]CAG1970391.1 unnamed protein product [Fusarium graminearum]CAG1997014.1 unnamed protein product [Fusarium graminearum]
MTSEVDHNSRTNNLVIGATSAVSGFLNRSATVKDSATRRASRPPRGSSRRRLSDLSSPLSLSLMGFFV